MRLPRFNPTWVVLSLLSFLLIGHISYTRESLLFCERALYTELETLAKESIEDKPLKFTEVCPEVRQRAETAMNRWLDVVLALLVQFHPPMPKP